MLCTRFTDYNQRSIPEKNNFFLFFRIFIHRKHLMFENEIKNVYSEPKDDSKTFCAKRAAHERKILKLKWSALKKHGWEYMFFSFSFAKNIAKFGDKN